MIVCATNSKEVIKLLVKDIDYVVNGRAIEIINKDYIPVKTEHGGYENIWNLKIQYEYDPKLHLNRKERRQNRGGNIK